MKISELMTKLKEAKAKHGDLVVVIPSGESGSKAKAVRSLKAKKAKSPGKKGSTVYTYKESGMFDDKPVKKDTTVLEIQS